MLSSKNILGAGQTHIFCHRCSSDALLRELRARPRACLPCWADRDSEPQTAKLPVAPCLPFLMINYSISENGCPPSSCQCTQRGAGEITLHIVHIVMGRAPNIASFFGSLVMRATFFFIFCCRPQDLKTLWNWWQQFGALQRLQGRSFLIRRTTNSSWDPRSEHFLRFD